jgi:cytochrome c oxidase assembly protein subunit 15
MRAAIAGTILVLVVIVTSSFLRLVQFGVGCEDWPSCYRVAQAAPGASLSPYARLTPWMRVLHRVAAAGIGVVVIVVAVGAWFKPRRPVVTLGAAALITLTLFLAVLGRMTTGSHLPAVTVGNVLGGMTMLGLFWWLWLEISAARRTGTPGIVLAGAFGLLMLALQFALGTLVSANQASAACTGFPGCNAVAAGAWDFAAFDPWRPPSPGDPSDAARQTLHMAHRWSAWLVLAYLGWLASLWWRRGIGGRTLAAAALLVCVQFGLGVAVVLGGVPLWVTVAHNGSAGLVLILLLTLVFHSRPAEDAAVSSACQTVTSM